jgi:hypothetical protein
MILKVEQYVIRTNKGIETYKEDLLELFMGDKEKAEKSFDKHVDPLGKFASIEEIIKDAFDDPHIKDVQYEITELEGKMIIAIAWIE